MKSICVATAAALLTMVSVAGCAIGASAQTLKVLHNFGGTQSDGANPYAGVIFDSQGNLYGSAESGGVLECDGLHGCGTVFELTPNSDGSWSESVLTRFEGQGGYGGRPVAPVILDRQGNVFGTYACTLDCFGSHGGGVYELVRGGDGSWTDLTVADYWNDAEECADGVCGVTFDPAGHLYLATQQYQGYPFYDAGAVLALGRLSALHWYTLVADAFTGGSDGNSPTSGLISDASGRLYGMTSGGGPGDRGVIYQLKRSTGGVGWTETVLYTFHYNADGALPLAGVVFDASGNLYGTTSRGGAAGLGTVFELTPNPDGSWSETILYSFKEAGDASQPNSALAIDAAGNLYGTAAAGAYGHGAIFKVSRSGGQWTESVVYSFTGNSDGDTPVGGVAIDAAGNLYGTTAYGGAYPNCPDEPFCGGVAYEITQ